MNQYPFSMNQYQFYLGVDWGTRSHELCLIQAAKPDPQRQSIAHEPRHLGRMLEWIDTRIAGQWSRLAVAIERPHCLLVQLLLARQAAVFAINPKQLDSFRTRYNVAGAKDDRLDALALADTLVKDAYAYQPVAIQPPAEMMLRELQHTKEYVECDWRRQCNRLGEMLVRYYPALLEVAGGADEPWLWELLRMAPTPAQGAALSLKRLAMLLRRHRLRRISAEQLRQLLTQCPLELDAAFVAAQAERTLSLLRGIKPLFEEKRRLETQVAAALETIAQAEATAREAAVAASEAAAALTEADPPPPTDYEIIDSMSGVGPGTLATIYSEAIEPLRRGHLRRIRALSGVAPITERSGKTCSIQMRYACNGRLRRALHHAANVACQRVPYWGKCYAQMRQHRMSHGRALRAIGDKMLKVLISMLHHRTLFDPERVGRMQTGQLAA